MWKDGGPDVCNLHDSRKPQDGHTRAASAAGNKETQVSHTCRCIALDTCTVFLRSCRFRMLPPMNPMAFKAGRAIYHEIYNRRSTGAGCHPHVPPGVCRCDCMLCVRAFAYARVLRGWRLCGQRVAKTCSPQLSLQ